MRVAFVVPGLELYGGIAVVAGHARLLRENHGVDAQLVLARADRAAAGWSHVGLGGVPVLELEAASAAEPFDVAVATWWETTMHLHRVPADRYAYFVQSLEDRFYDAEAALAAAAAMTYALPLAQITEARWIADQLAALRGPGAPLPRYVRNGIDKTVFAVPDEPPAREQGPLRVLIEGNPSVPNKAVPEAIAATAAMTEPVHVTLVTPDRAAAASVADLVDQVAGPLTAVEMAAHYRDSDVVLKLSRVEGMAAPPLEGFHCGATCVTTPVTGHDEYVIDGENALITSWDDVRGTARLLDLLAADRALLERLRSRALETARAWPSTAESTAEMAEALTAIAADASQDPTAAAAAMASAIRVMLTGAAARDREHARLQARMDRVERIVNRGPLRLARRLRAGKGS